MRHTLILRVALFVAASAAACVVANAQTTLFSTTDLDEAATNYALPFLATSTLTTISYAGYNLPSFIEISNNGVYASGSNANLLGPSFAFTPAPAGSDSFTFGDGTAVPALAFGSVVVDSYDTYSQTITTVAGGLYDVDFTYQNSSDPSGFMLTTSGAPAPAGAPAPVAGAGLLSFFGAGGVAMRKRAKRWMANVVARRAALA